MSKTKNDTVPVAREESAVSKLQKMVQIKHSYFIRWYLTPEDEREPYEELAKRNGLPMNYNVAKDWLLREDIQNGLKFWAKSQQVDKFIRLQNSMYEKALKGDSAAATTYLKFAESNFYDDVVDEANEALNNIDLSVGDDIE